MAGCRASWAWAISTSRADAWKRVNGKSCWHNPTFETKERHWDSNSGPLTRKKVVKLWKASSNLVSHCQVGDPDQKDPSLISFLWWLVVNSPIPLQVKPPGFQYPTAARLEDGSEVATGPNLPGKAGGSSRHCLLVWGSPCCLCYCDTLQGSNLAVRGLFHFFHPGRNFKPAVGPARRVETFPV